MIEVNEGRRVLVGKQIKRNVVKYTYERSILQKLNTWKKTHTTLLYTYRDRSAWLFVTPAHNYLHTP